MPNFGPVMGEGGQANLDQNSEDGKPPYINATDGISTLPFSNIDFAAYGKPNGAISTAPISTNITDANMSDDVNNIWTPFGDVDVSKGLKDLSNTILNKDNVAQQYIDKAKEYISPTKETVQVAQDKIAPAIEQAKTNVEKIAPSVSQQNKPISDSVSTQNIKTNTTALQELFKNSGAVKSLIGKNFNGKIDGNIGAQTNSFASEIEHQLAEILGTTKIFGQVLSTTADDVEQAINLALAYKTRQKQSTAMFNFDSIILNRSDRIYALSKFLIKAHKD